MSLCCASTLAAQSAAVKEEKVLTLEGLRAGYCVRYLTSPKRAGELVKSGLTAVRADQDQALHPALRQVIHDQPEYAAWAPTSLCFYYTDAVSIGDRRIVEHNPRNAQMLGVWTLAALEQGSGNRRDLVLDMYASRERLRKAASNSLIVLEDAEAGFRAGSDTTGDEYSQKLGKTRLVWNGRTAGARARVDQPLTESWRVPGGRRVVWVGDFSLSPTWARALAGSLKVEGKGDLAKDLRSSPTRFVGPFYQGGEGRLRLTR
jgi:hypothetical protein